MSSKDPLFEGTVVELLKEWHESEAGKHWMDKGNRRIVIYPAKKAWELLNEPNGQPKNSSTTV